MSLVTPYQDLNEVLAEMVNGIKQALGNTFVTACLQGSFATGDFDRYSDCDFIIVHDGELSDAQVQSLQTLHKMLFALNCPWAQHLEGSYFPRDIIRDFRLSGQPVWYLEHGDDFLIRSNHCNSVVVRWVLYHHGFVLEGTNPQNLIDPIPVLELQKEIRQTMLDWAEEIFSHPKRFENWFYQTFIVLNYCRMLHDLRTGSTNSKRVGAEWAKTIVDASWFDLIDRAWEGRPDPYLSYRTLANPEDFRRTLEFVSYINSFI